MDHYVEKHPYIEPSTSHSMKIYLSLGVPDKEALSMLRNRVPMDRYTPPPEPQVYLFMYVCRSPHKGVLLQNGEKHLVTVH